MRRSNTSPSSRSFATESRLGGKARKMLFRPLRSTGANLGSGSRRVGSRGGVNRLDRDASHVAIARVSRGAEKPRRGDAVDATGRQRVSVVGWGTTHINRARGDTRRAFSSTPPWLCYMRPGPGRSRGRPARLYHGACRDARRLGGTRALSARPSSRGRHRENLHSRKRASRFHARFSPAPRGARRTW